MAYDKKKFGRQLREDLKRAESSTDARGIALGRKISEYMKSREFEADAAVGRTGSFFAGSRHTDAERLDYYRIHGLASCDDYPGGDAQFQVDVLSGKYHDDGFADGPLKREDAYIVDRMRDGRLDFDTRVLRFCPHMAISRAFDEIMESRGFCIVTHKDPIP